MPNAIRNFLITTISSPLRRSFSRCAATYFRVVEVGPRDGLQNEKAVLDTSDKLELIAKLGKCGLRTIETTSFVSPKWVPQTGSFSLYELFHMADHIELVTKLDKLRGVSYPVLVPNMAGLRSVIDCGAVSDIAVFCSASETFSRKNVNCSMAEGLKRACMVTHAARKAGLNIRGYVSCVVNCAYEGTIKPGIVADVVEKLLASGCHEVSLGDTTGAGGAGSVGTLLDTIILSGLPTSKLAVHFHDTYGQALANVLVAIEKGITAADSSVSGLGGCPYSRSATGNLATEDLIYMLHDLGLKTGVDLEELVNTSNWVCEKLHCPVRSKVAVAYLGKSESGKFQFSQ